MAGKRYTEEQDHSGPERGRGRCEDRGAVPQAACAMWLCIKKPACLNIQTSLSKSHRPWMARTAES